MLSFEIGEIGTTANSLQTYLADIHKLSIKERVSIEKKYKDLSAENPGEEDDIWNYLEEDYELYKTTFGKIANDSVFLTNQTLFEGKMQHLTKLIKEGIIAPVSIYREDNSLGPVVNYYNEMKTITGLSFSALTPVWNKLSEYRKVRNLITHHNSNLMKNLALPLTGQVDYPLVSAIPAIQIEPNGDFKISEEYVHKAIDDTGKFLRELVTLLRTIPLTNIKQ